VIDNSDEVQRIELLIHRERLAEARSLLEGDLGGSLDRSTALALMGEVLAGLAEFDKATAAAREALAIDMRNARAHYVLGVVAVALDQPQAAVQHLATAVSLEPEYAQAHYALGSLLLSAGHTDAAASELQTAARLDPGNWRYAAGVALIDPPRVRYRALRAAYRQGLREQPASIRLRFKLLLAYLAAPVAAVLGDAPRVDPQVSYAAFQRVMARVPYVTYALLASLALVFFLIETPNGSMDPAVLDKYGAEDPWAIIHLHEYWRLLTPLFLHIGFTHLAVNCMSLYFVGTLYERCVGRLRFIYVYFVAGLGGSVVSLAAVNDLAAGASGAIFGIFGALGVYAFKNRAVFGLISRRLVNSVLGLSVLNLLLPVIDPQVDGWAHFGGLLTGVAAGLVAGPWLAAGNLAGADDLLRERRQPSTVIGAMAAIVFVTLLACVVVVTVNPLGV
jgi:membrane associated rhomboid family serine protease/Tfp pilus assembly protein PilF